MLLGAHVSVAGGLDKAPQNGVDLGCDVIQLFTRNQRRWDHPRVDEEEAAAFKSAFKASKLKGAIVHASYLLNLASPDAGTWNRSYEAFVAEAERCDSLGLDRFVFHPGAHMKKGVQAGCQRIAQALSKALDATEGSHVRFLMETMAGQGTTIGDDFSDLANILELAGNDKRVGVCVDTCHVWAAGHDLASSQGYESMVDRIEETIGVKRVLAFHLNDSEKERGARRDRHANIGEGTIGTHGFEPLMKDPRFAGVPMALETPMAEQGYPRDLRRLRGLDPV